MQRICFTMLVADRSRDEYVRAHAEPWPELLVELDRTGWQNYSLFLRDDGLLVGYLESPDFAAAQLAMSSTDVSARWSREMDRLVEPGSTMLYPRLEAHLGSERAAHRHCIVLDAAVDLDLSACAAAGLRNVSVFSQQLAGEGGRTIIYAEASGAGILDWSPLGPIAAAAPPLVEVFNLAAQLERLRA